MINTEDNPELQQIFDENSSLNKQESPVSITEKGDVFDDLGKITRQLHQALHELGLDRKLSDAANAIPDTKDRLKYVAELTEKAADRVLNATEKVQPLNDTLGEQAKSLEVRWNDILTKDSNIEDFKKLVYETHTHFIQMSEVSNIIKNELMEIIMAQDFQDLTGQVIKKLITITSDLESKLLEVLVHHAPNERPELTTGLSGPNYLETPALNTVANQEEVDNLLESLGF